MEPNGKDRLVLDLEPRLEIWLRRSGTWRITHFSMAIAGIVATSLVASRPSFLPDAWSSFFAWLALAIVIFLATFDPGRRSQALMDAWRRASLALSDYVSDPTTDKREALIASIRQGEYVIASADPQ